MSDSVYEVYTLTLRHQYWDGENRVDIEEPIQVRQMLDRRFSVGKPYVVNQMVRELSEYMMRLLAERKEGENEAYGG